MRCKYVSYILLFFQVQTINNCLQTISKRSPTTQYPTSSPVSLSLAESSGGMEELREATLADIEEEGRAGEERMLQEVIEDSQLLLMQFSINQLSLEIHSRGKEKINKTFHVCMQALKYLEIGTCPASQKLLAYMGKI